MPKVTIEKHRNSLRLRWKYQGERGCFTPSGAKNNPLGRAIVADVKSRIELEMQAGTFNPQKYKRRTGKGGAEISPANLIRAYGKTKLKDGDIGDRSYQARYEPLAITLDKSLDIPCHKLSRKQALNFARECDRRLTAGTAKGRLWLLSSAWEWGKKHYDVGNENPWQGLTDTIKSKPKKKHVKAFNIDELKAIKTAFEGSKYYGIVVLLMATAARPGEIFGLRWMDLSEDFTRIWIRNAVSRGEITGTTKTGIDRQVPLTTEASQLLRDRYQHQEPESLIFSGVDKAPIKDQTFRTAWRRALAKAGIEYRCPRNIRPSIISINRLMNPNLDPVKFAELCGHSLKTQDKIYRRALHTVEFIDI